jgi:hypothetical protein
LFVFDGCNYNCVAVEASGVPGDDVEISPELSVNFTGVCFAGVDFVVQFVVLFWMTSAPLSGSSARPGSI